MILCERDWLSLTVVSFPDHHAKFVVWFTSTASPWEALVGWWPFLLNERRCVVEATRRDKQKPTALYKVHVAQPT